jgi:hypothetical protein
LTIANGHVYVGAFGNGKEHGHVYVDAFENSKRHGQGTMTFTNGDVGAFENNNAVRALGPTLTVTSS